MQNYHYLKIQRKHNYYTTNKVMLQ